MDAVGQLVGRKKEGEKETKRRRGVEVATG
jgi:hypothetical protein